MGFLDELFGKKEEPAKPGLPFNFTTTLRPMRLSARKENCVEVLVSITNVTSEPFLASATLELPKALGFENAVVAKVKEIRLGEIPAGKTKVASFSVCASSQTAAGTYAMVLTINQHYRDYSHVMNYAKKTVEIRAV
ncbi:MAG: hypothetical protein N3G80_02660 [Candidatus Micrarchaeota archaeon]|nr:hypothetical protein [Candidatus Micrarchaeota archaeon]